MRTGLLIESSSLLSHSDNPRPMRASNAPNLSDLQQNLNNPNILRHFNNETILLIFLMITLFFVNIYSIIKNQVLKTINNVISRIWRKIITHPPKSYQSEKTKIQFKNKFEINHCAICLNNIDYEVSVSCFHRFCGKFKFIKRFYCFFNQNIAHCIMNYWSSQNHSQLKCPICRRLISLLHIDYDTQFDSQEYFKTNNESNIINITHEIYHYNYLYGNKERSVKFDHFLFKIFLKFLKSFIKLLWKHLFL